MDDQQILDEVKEWFISCLGCAAGRREFSKNRYMLAVARTTQEVRECFEAYVRALEARTAVACLIICPTVHPEQNSYNVSQEVRRLSALFSPLGEHSAEALATGGALNKKLYLTCPVTGVKVLFEDFDAVAFCPQSEDLDDPLYDPLMAAPIPAVNFNSDVYAFSIFCRDMSLQKFSREVYELTAIERSQLYGAVLQGWQRIAQRTLGNYIQMTNVEKCPVYLHDNNRYWYANHQDPAFAESEKALYRHDMPLIYVPKIFCEWEQYFATGRIPDFSETATPGSQHLDACEPTLEAL
ncbi:hypothetical protein DYL59_26730 [Pseudomonas kairouanensis]|uniref:Uncharacterized protein n=1 Tax=Pseudomonas kairouanensis TaxID=2293832 RepID=A0A4Z0AFN0_9PSED|nr:hypothetical protein [Pseudomonas kairouanensis]TFY85104.1 hypothetical protein DYL59_26730 [Pseudomonas kairouanensis]